MYIQPGTVSKILWHFTGGPGWDHDDKCYSQNLKADDEAFKILYNIIQTKTLSVGSNNELINYVIPEQNVIYLKGDGSEPEKRREYNVPADIESKKVCCVAEIPIQHISYHALRYGKFAIGFHRESLIKNGFNPVFYTFTSEGFIYHIINAIEYTSLIAKDIIGLSEMVKDVIIEMKDYIVDSSVKEKLIFPAFSLEKQYKDKLIYIDAVLQYFAAYIKTIKNDEFDTCYCEREWRKTENFIFEYSDISMIVMPREFLKNIDDMCKGLQLPRSIPIVPWEDLVEH